MVTSPSADFCPRTPPSWHLHFILSALVLDQIVTKRKSQKFYFRGSRRRLPSLWIAGAIAVAYRDTGIPSLTKGCNILLEFKDDATGQKLTAADVERCDAAWHSERLMLLGWVLGAPIALFMLGTAAAWVIVGFRK
jgi:hypothetical protein